VKNFTIPHLKDLIVGLFGVYEIFAYATQLYENQVFPNTDASL